MNKTPGQLAYEKWAAAQSPLSYIHSRPWSDLDEWLKEAWEKDMVKATLVATKSILETKGWTQRSYHDEKGRVCLSEALRQGAVHVASNQSQETYGLQKTQLFGEGRDTILTVINATEFGIVSYNDAPGRTKEEILATLDQAIRIVS